MSYKNNKFKKSTPTWNGKFELSDESFSISSIQDYFKYGYIFFLPRFSVMTIHESQDCKGRRRVFL